MEIKRKQEEEVRKKREEEERKLQVRDRSFDGLISVSFIWVWGLG